MKKEGKGIISACLAGVSCRYDGKSQAHPKAKELLATGCAIVVCPEQLGGLSTPREPSEIRGDQVFSRSGKDVTAEFTKGAEETLALARATGARWALLKENSPSCGCRFIYDGTFSGKKIPGKGITARFLEEGGLKVFSDEDL